MTDLAEACAAIAARRYSVSGHRYTSDNANEAGGWVIRWSVCECGQPVVAKGPTLAEATAAALRAGRDHRACAQLARNGEAA